MRENEFERKMQEQMEELHLRPSTSVWLKVEQQLQQKKKRRVIFFFFLFAGLILVGYSGYIFLQPAKSALTRQEDKNVPVNSAAINKNEKNDQSTSTIQKNDITKQPFNEPASPVEETVKPFAEPGRSNTNINSSISSVMIVNNTAGASTQNKKSRYSQADDVTYSYTKPGTANKRKNESNAVPSTTTGNGQQPVPVEENKEVIALETSVTPVSGNNIAAKQDSGVIHKDSTDSNIPVAAIAKNKKKRSGIKWGYEISGGKNFSVDHVFSVLKARQTQQDALANVSPSNGVGNGQSGYQPMRPPSAIKASAAFKVGIIMQWQLNKRSNVSTGIRYSYLSEQIKIGGYNDTLVLSNSYQYNAVQNGIYRSVPDKKYNNTYHFIELPILYQVQLNKNEKTAILWNSGISLNYLVGTKALVYDTVASGIYYKNKEAFHRLNFNLRTGFDLRFGASNKMQWSVGPELSISTTSLLKQDAIIKKRYLLYTGLTARFILP